MKNDTRNRSIFMDRERYNIFSYRKNTRKFLFFAGKEEKEES